MNNTLFAIVLLLFMVIAVSYFKKNKKETFEGVFIAQPSKCYQCEAELEKKKK